MITPALPKESIEEIDAALGVLSQGLAAAKDRSERAAVVEKVNALLDERLKHMSPIKAVVDLEKFGGPVGSVGVSIK